MYEPPTRSRHTVIRAFYCAGQGVGELFAQGRNAKIQFAAGAIAVAVAVWLDCSAMEWAVLCLTIGLVLALEGANTAIELAVDLASPDIHPLAKRSKDMAAAAVLIASVAACGVGVAIFLPKLLAHAKMG
jgi:diacylglycerol kinase